MKGRRKHDGDKVENKIPFRRHFKIMKKIYINHKKYEVF